MDLAGNRCSSDRWLHTDRMTAKKRLLKNLTPDKRTHSRYLYIIANARVGVHVFLRLEQSFGRMTFVALLLSGIFHSPHVLAIKYGYRVDSNSMPARSTVLIVISHGEGAQKEFGICSGSLVGKNLVLTAAHCLRNDGGVRSLGDLRIYFADFNGKDWDPIYTRAVSDVRVHPQFHENGVHNPIGEMHDVALVRIDREAPALFQPVRLSSDPSVLSKGSKITLAGYGRRLPLGDSREPAERVLRAYDTEVLDPRNETSGMLEYFHNSQFYDYEDPEGMRRNLGGMMAGDSGGPAFATLNGKPFVVGIASCYRYPEQRPFYENVAVHYSWLLEAAKAMNTNFAYVD
jgi:secreted trypsin-like serine protease